MIQVDSICSITFLQILMHIQTLRYFIIQLLKLCNFKTHNLLNCFSSRSSIVTLRNLTFSCIHSMGEIINLFITNNFKTHNLLNILLSYKHYCCDHLLKIIAVKKYFLEIIQPYICMKILLFIKIFNLFDTRMTKWSSN